jgi:alkylation response protein AidB-like acyl-CoA dehydrogenase
VDQRRIFIEEMNAAGAPLTSVFGVVMIGPVLYTFGNEEQKKQHLPGIIDGSTLWCQGYSEPGAGSDLASLKTKAEDKGDHYLVNGQKIWTTQAHWADWMFCLVRTDQDAPKQKGISFILIDMKTPGIEIRPIVSIDNQHHLNEVFFTDVKVPKENLIGEENKGWTYAKFLLDHERAGVAGIGLLKVELEQLRNLANDDSVYSTPLMQDPGFAEKLADLEMRLEALEMLESRALTAAPDSLEGIKCALPLKLQGSELQQDVAELFIEAMGYSTLLKRDNTASENEALYTLGTDRMMNYLFSRSHSIYGGTSEVQKMIMAKLALGL